MIAAHAQPSPGDVFASTDSGTVLQFDSSGKLRATLQSDLSGVLTGSAFDQNANFYVTAGFAHGNVVKFDAHLKFVGPFGSHYEHEPESVLVDAAGNIYVGAAQESGDRAVIKKLSSDGRLLDSYAVERDDRGSDWIDLASDQKTMFYTSEGGRVKRLDLSSRSQLPDFSHAGNTLYAFRLLPDGGLLAANTHNALRLDKNGGIVRTYLDGADDLFALNLDPDRSSFWTAEQRKGEIIKVDIESGKILQTIQAGTHINGLSVFGELTMSMSAHPEPPPAPPPPPPQARVTFGSLLPCLFGPLRSGSAGQSSLDLSSSKLTGPVTVEIRSNFSLNGAALEIDTGTGWRKLGADPLTVDLDPAAPRNWPVRLRVGDCPGALSVEDPWIEVRTTTPEGAVDKVRTAVRANIKRDSWLHCWWPILVVVAAILFGLFVLYGFWSPARFTARIGVLMAPDEDIENEGFFHPIRGQPGSRAGFYRDARVYVCQDFRVSGKASNAIAELRAGKNQIRLLPMMSLWRRTPDGEWEELVREVYVRTGVLYRNEAKSFYFELRNR